MNLHSPTTDKYFQVAFVGIDMFTGKKHEDMCLAHHKMSVPSTTNTDMILVSISSDGFLTLMNDGGELRSDIRLPDNEMLANCVKAKFESVGDNEDVLVSCESVQKTPKKLSLSGEMLDLHVAIVHHVSSSLWVSHCRSSCATKCNNNGLF